MITTGSKWFFGLGPGVVRARGRLRLQHRRQPARSAHRRLLRRRRRPPRLHAARLHRRRRASSSAHRRRSPATPTRGRWPSWPAPTRRRRPCAPAYPSLLAGASAPSAPPWSCSGLVISNVLFMVGCFVLARRARRVDGAGLVRPRHRRPGDEPPGPPPDDGALRGAAGRLPRRRRPRDRLLPPAPHRRPSSARSGSPPASASSILAVGVLIATRPKLSPNVVAGVLTVARARASSWPASPPPPAASASSSSTRRSTARRRREHDAEGDEPTGNTPLTPEGTKAVTTTTVAEGEG